MKKQYYSLLIILVIAIISLILASCGGSGGDSDVEITDTDATTDTSTTTTTTVSSTGSSSTATTSTSATTTTTPITETASIADPIDTISDATTDATTDTEQAEFTPKFILKIDNDYYLSDGDTTELWQSGNIAKAGNKIFSVENQLLTFDATGDILETIDLDHVPTKIKNTIYGNYYCVEITPAEALALGGQSKYYTDIYKDGINIGIHWSFNQYRCADILSVGTNVFIKDEFSAYHVVDGTAENVAHVVDDRFYMHNIDMNDMNAGFNDRLESFELGFAPIARQWILYDDFEYSETGYTWNDTDGLLYDGTGLTAMGAFNSSPYPVTPENPNGEQPTLLAVGAILDKLYWIECDSGWLFEYDATEDTLTQLWRVYDGDGLRASGVLKRDSLKPLIVDSDLYFSNDSSVFCLDLLTGFVNVFYAGIGEVIKYD